MRQYATATELAAYPGGDAVPAGDADALLRTASRLVDRLLRGRVYDTDTEGYPLDADKQLALQDAACAIAVEAYDTGALEAGGSQEWKSVGIGSVSLSGRTAKPGTVTLDGVTIPPAALIALADVGPLVVIVQ